MGEYIDIVDAWLKSKPSAMKNEELYVLIRTFVKALREYWDELKDAKQKIALQQTVIIALETSMTAAENRIQTLEADMLILKG